MLDSDRAFTGSNLKHPYILTGTHWLLSLYGFYIQLCIRATVVSCKGSLRSINLNWKSVLVKKQEEKLFTL